MTFWLKLVIVNVLLTLFFLDLQLLVAFDGVVELFAAIDDLLGELTLEH